MAEINAACSNKTCGTGSSTNNGTPVNNFYNYTYTQLLFLANEINVTGGTIEKIGFQYGYSTAMTAKTNVTIYMANTTKSSFSNGNDWVLTGLTPVYSGSLNCSGNGTWNDFTLNTPFDYDGGNLLVVIDDNSGDYNNSSYVFRYTETSGYTVLTTQSDGTHYSHVGGTAPSSGGYNKKRCNTRFCITACSGHRSGTFAFNPPTENYNYVIGSGDFAEPTIQNTLSPAGTVTYTSSNPAVATVSSTTGAVTFTGLEGEVTIFAVSSSGNYCNERASYNISVSDNCVKIGTGTSTTSSTPLSTGWKNSYDQIIYTPEEVGIGMINMIGFQSTGSNSVARQVDIYMGETTQSSFASTTDWVPYENLSHVYSGTWNITSGWNMFPVNFLYTGMGNLVIAIDCGATTYTTSYFSYTSTTDYMTIYAYSDTYDAVPATIESYQGSKSRLQYRPNTKICIDACTIRPTVEFENTMAMCYQGSNCPMLPLTNTSSGTVHYTSSDETIATIDNDGNITTLERGETTIEVFVEMDGNVCPAKASYVLQVVCPALIPSAESVSMCEGGTVTLNASTAGGGDLEWFDAVDATTPVHTGDSYTINADHSTTYFVATYNDEYDCASSRVPAYINVFDLAYESTTQNISGYVGVAMYGYPPTGSTSGTSYTATGMPAWMTLNPDGSFNGTPTAAGSGSFTITATNGSCSKTITINWTVVANNLTCCDPDAFYLFKNGDPLPIRKDDDGFYYINVCKDEPATFRIQPLANCSGYTYNWRLASSTGGLLVEVTGATFTYTYDRAMGYNMTLTINKGNPNSCTVAFPIRIRVAGVFQVATRPSFDLCKGEPFNIYVSSDGIGSVDVVRPNGGSATTLGVPDTVWLPDGVPCNGTCFFRSCVTFSDFSTGATIRDENDLLYVLLNIEHSFIGDIYIALSCPNGQRVVILPQSGNGSANCRSEIPTGYDSWPGETSNTSYDFGISGSGYSSDCNSQSTIGTGWNYIWSNNTVRGYEYAGGTYGYIYESANVGHDNSSSIDSSHYADMSQIYHPMESFANLVGCPLNGTWCIEVVDGWSIDDGNIFNWELGLNEELLPDSWTYSVDVDSAWVDCGWPTSKAGVYMEITPPEDFVGTTNCDLNLRDEYGCISHYNNIVTVTMNNTESSYTNVGPQCEPYYWDLSGETYNVSGEYYAQGLTDHGCPKRDTLNLLVDGATYDTVTAQACQSYHWDVNGQDYTSSGTYDATLQSAMGCDSNITLILEILPELTTTKDTAVCPITFPFDWNGAHFTTAGTQELDLLTAGGCDSIVTLTVTALSKPVVNLANPATANGCPIPTTQNYVVTTNVTGGTGPFTYAWTGSYTGTDANATIPGTGTCGDFSVEVIVTDANGCMDTNNTSFSAIDVEAPTFNSPITTTAAILSGNNCVYLVPDIIAMVQPQDNCGIVSQVQTPTANSQITGETDVTVVVTDACGNVDSITVHLTVPATVEAEIEHTDVACNGGNDGVVNVFNVTGGSGGYHYSWSATGGGSSSSMGDVATITGCTAGFYAVVVSDANGCSVTLNDTINESSDMVLVLTADTVQCYNTATGRITITTLTGGTGVYSEYNWSNGEHSSTGIENIMPGQYTLTVIDDANCRVTASATVANRTQLVVSPAGSVNTLCYGSADGSASVSAVGGVTPYTFVRSNTDTNTTGTFTSLAAGSYQVQVIDAKGCTNTTTITVGQPALLQLQETMSAHQNVDCFGNSTGGVTVAAYGGTPQYTYELNGVTNNTGVFANQLAEGTYTVNVTDNNNCTAQTTVTITQPTLLQISATHEDLRCKMDGSGSIDLTVWGGTTPYSYQWRYNNTNYATSQDVSGIMAGEYMVTVTDANGCPHDTTITVTEPEGMVLTMSPAVAICLYESADISATIQDGTGTPPYRFTWDNGHTNNGVSTDQQTVTPNTTTIYTVNVLDAGDCPMTGQVTVTVNYPTTGIDNQRACDSYVWPTNGAEYTESTSAPMVSTMTNVAGCDSTAILHLVIVYSSEGVDRQTACDSYKWLHNGQTYYESTNTPSVVLQGGNSVGCDSTITLDLTINNSVTTHDSDVVICENDDPYIWNGAFFTENGRYEIHLRTVNDCDSLVWFTLTVHDTNHTYIYDTCMVKQLPWEWGGRTYPTPVTDDLFSFLNVYGCDSLVYYNLEAIFDCSEFLQFPSVVTPNGDGLNDVFHIVGLIEEECYPLNKLTIYNRWGAKVYEVDNIDEESDFWDPAAERTPAGTYYFRFDGDGFKGHVERKGVVEVVK
ncbi:MAG: gliding motility-associated C-terminal domain-containing protein [Bacteroidales bacterium]|nr:gliding motility-associated C-terminal domain-containing protein [Bacteroidales bacterium]